MIGSDPDDIRAKYAELRGMCYPRGFDLLDALENAMLRDNAMLAMHDRVGQLQEKLAGGHSVHADLYAIQGGDVVNLYGGMSEKRGDAA